MRIKWRKRTPLAGSLDPTLTKDETLEEDHTAPPPDTWRARSDRSETQADYYPKSRYGSKL